MSYTKPIFTLSKSDAATAGGKGASLGEMTNAGIPVPPGFVVTAAAFDLYVQSDQFDSLLQAEILSAFDNLDCDFVAVRSSATVEDGVSASWAGELETYLNTTRENLLENIEKCWRSLWSERAIAYRNEHHLRSTKISVAVVVQKMIQSDVSGITFTVHPVTKDPDSMIIEACWGLGELIVGGEVTPDSYTVRKSDLAILDVYQNDQEEMLIRNSVIPAQAGIQCVLVPVPSADRSQRKLSDDQVRALASTCVTIENHYGFPCDIEWAIENGKLFILQSRPITTL
ncbi:MAG: PEP/pyruvate-binding domain-containing protein [Patescibacteria group bacterium]